MKNVINWKQDESLFPSKEQYLMAHDKKGRNIAFKQLPKHIQRIKGIDNMQIIASLPKTDKNHFPVVHAVQDVRDDLQYVSFEARNRFSGKECMLGFFLYDYKFNKPLWDRLEETTSLISHYETIIGPDYSLYLGSGWEVQNKYNIYKSRAITAYWQYCGLKVIPVATWGDAESFNYCFEGLPENSVIAVCGIGHDCTPWRHHLWCAAIAELVRQKHPTKILVYGGKPCFIESVSVKMVFIEDFITKRFRHAE